jgi:hypothetical protein
MNTESPVKTKGQPNIYSSPSNCSSSNEQGDPLGSCHAPPMGLFPSQSQYGIYNWGCTIEYTIISMPPNAPGSQND